MNGPRTLACCKHADLRVRSEPPRPNGLVPLFLSGCFSGTGNESKTGDLAGYLSWGKNKPVLFFLQGRCAACMQEFELFAREYEALKKRNVETTSVRTKDAETT